MIYRKSDTDDWPCDVVAAAAAASLDCTGHLVIMDLKLVVVVLKT